MREWEELGTEITDRWNEVHKKSMIMLILLVALTERPMWSKELEEWCLAATGWEISDRGLHRTLKRMNGLGLTSYAEDAAPRTGIKRKKYALTDFGLSVLKNMKKTSLKYLYNDSFMKRLGKI